MIARYRAEKEARGLLDYDDLIAKTRDLLSRVSAAWVHYKLDLGIDHLLIDEAQDTSPEQWDIVERLVAEFAVGAGARGTLARSIFAVGDDKQSIFSFQGADPREFHEKQSRFKRDLRGRRDRMARRPPRLFVPLERQRADRRRSTCSQAQAVFRSVTTDEGGISAHLALPDAAPGLVEIWPLVEPEKREPVAAVGLSRSTRPRRRARASSSRGRSPRRCGSGSSARTSVGTGDERHAVRPGDILVLVRQRGPLFEAIIRALKNEGIDVAGADRLVLTEHIAVMDLLALADAHAAAGRRSRARDRAQEPAVRPDRRRAVRARVGPQGQPARGA